MTIADITLTAFTIFFVAGANLFHLAVMAAGRIIGESLDAKKHRELIARAIEEAEIRA